jgi:hypothetical protein
LRNPLKMEGPLVPSTKESPMQRISFDFDVITGPTTPRPPPQPEPKPEAGTSEPAAAERHDGETDRAPVS